MLSIFSSSLESREGMSVSGVTWKMRGKLSSPGFFDASEGFPMPFKEAKSRAYACLGGVYVAWTVEQRVRV